MNQPLLLIQDLTVSQPIVNKELVHDVNLSIDKGEMVALIGESGSGKSMTARSIMGLLPNGMEASGRILFQEKNLLSLPYEKHRKLLGREIGMIFQDYRGSFTPYIKVGNQMVEAIRTHYSIGKKEAKSIVQDALNEMGLDAERIYRSYPFQLSGGQVQRASIAMSLALKPSLLICDEVTSALDVMNGNKVLHYINKVRKSTGCGVLFITHDLAQAFKVTDRMYVMQKGEIIEEGLPEQIRCHHQHPYTKKLCSCLLELPKNIPVKKERVSFL
ncbi:ABC transporter ATP-binding protein [Sutcliffiella halmapala]|uniref:ABC transporter ATP-binding protein n=1 Tax=Sutcliffiella halmapala TaxID=79882 RepID=UPI0009953E6B|nr:ABC transporter ATP-binding protein [Sutcliffiella halmapala]